MTKQTLRNKIYAYIYAFDQKNTEWCNTIIAELESENYHKLVGLLLEGKYQAAHNWIDKNV